MFFWLCDVSFEANLVSTCANNSCFSVCNRLQTTRVYAFFALDSSRRTKEIKLAHYGRKSDFYSSFSSHFSPFPSCINITRYFELNRQFALLINTLRMSFTRVFTFTISVLPVFFGYLLLGVACFSNFSDRFSNIDEVAVALFAIANGDEIHATFFDLAENYPWLWFSRLYLYTFLILFILAILNIMIFLIEDAFSAAKTWDEKQHERDQQFSLANLIAILELEGKNINFESEDAHPAWQMLDPAGVTKDSFADLKPPDSSSSGGEDQPLLRQGEEEEDLMTPERAKSINQDPGSDSSSDSQTPPPWLRRSITSTINIERRKRANRRNKGKEDVVQDAADVSAIIDTAFETMQRNMRAQFDALKAELKLKSN